MLESKAIQQLDFNLLKVFESLYVERNMSATARALFLTPSAVSHQIKDLEEQLGTSLFHRETRSISLTNEGNKFYKVIQPIPEEQVSPVAMKHKLAIWASKLK